MKVQTADNNVSRENPRNRKVILIASISAAIIVTFIILLFTHVLDGVIMLNGESRECNLQSLQLSDEIKQNFDKAGTQKMMWKDMAVITGWGLINGQDSTNGEKYLVLDSEAGERYIFGTSTKSRTDVTKALKDGHNYDNSGYNAIINMRSIKDGTYRVGLAFKNNDGYVYNMSSLFLEKNGDTVGKAEFQSVLTDLKLPSSETNLKCNIDAIKDITTNGKKITVVSGWAFGDSKNAADQKVYVVLFSKDKYHVYDTMQVKRSDVTKALGKGDNLDNTGFKAGIPDDAIGNGEYMIGIYIKTPTQEYFKLTNKKLN